MKRLYPLALVLAAGLMAGRPAPAGEPAVETGAVVLDMDTVRHKPMPITTPDGAKADAGTVTLVDGKEGMACQFAFAASRASTFMTAWVPATPDWDQAEGLTFWVKGDGSDHWGGLELIDGSDYSLRYACAFPVDSTDWTRVVVPWRDLIPELAGPLVDPKNGYAPSRFKNLWVGKWHYWRAYPAQTFAIDHVALVRRIEPVPTPPFMDGVDRVRAKLAAGKPVTIVTMGDSLSDARHWANREVLWSSLLVKALEAETKARVTLVNPAIGGTTLSQNLILMPRWLKGTPKPDLVTVWFGYNDWDSSVRGERFAEYLGLAVDRIRRMTGGHADVLLMTTCPAFTRWDTMAEMAEAVRRVAREKQTGLADIAAAFHAAGSADAAKAKGYWVRDNTHLGTAGHKIACETVRKALR